MAQLFRVFLLKELRGWTHETALLEYLTQYPALCEALGFDTLPNQSTLWRSWNQRFIPDLQETVQTAARTILIKAQNADVAVPREPEQDLPPRGDGADGSAPDNRAILDKAQRITDHATWVVFPAFSLDRGNGCKIHENAYWDLQTYLGLRESLAANEGARSFVHESTRERTSHGVRLPPGNREWVQVDQAVYGRHHVGAFRAAILRLRVRLLAVLDLASCGSAGSGGVDW